MSIYDILSNGVCIMEAIKQKETDFCAFWNNLKSISPIVTKAYITRDKFTMYVHYKQQADILRYCVMTTPFPTLYPGSVAQERVDLSKYNWLTGDECPIMTLNSSYDCLATISRSLSLKDIISMRQTCKGFVRGFSSETVWRPILNTIKANCKSHVLYNNIPTSMTQVAQYLLYTNDIKVIENVLNNKPKACELLAKVLGLEVIRSTYTNKRKRVSGPLVHTTDGNAKANVAIGSTTLDGGFYATLWTTSKNNIRSHRRKKKHKHMERYVFGVIDEYRNALLKNE